MGDGKKLDKKRQDILRRLQDKIEFPLLILGFIWLFLLIVDLVTGLNSFFLATFNIIWIIFILEFLIEFWLAPVKPAYLSHNWLTVVSLLVPAFRLFRIFRVIRIFRAASVVRSIQLIRLLGSINRGMKALAGSLNRRGFVFVAVLTVIVIFGGAAGMYAFENGYSEDLSSYASAVWWTAMIVTTMGSGEWPKTTEGRVLTFFLALYAFSVFGYVTAALTTFFVGTEDNQENSSEKILNEIKLLKQELSDLRNRDFSPREINPPKNST